MLYISILYQSCSSIGGALAIDWGSVVEIGTRECSRRISEERGGGWCEELERGRPLFIAGEGCCGGSRWRPWRRLSGLQRGKARTACGCWHHGDHRVLAGAENGGRDGSGGFSVCHRPGGSRRQG
jgi:hypothetical protein